MSDGLTDRRSQPDKPPQPTEEQKAEGVNPKDLLGMNKAPLDLVPPVATLHAAVAHFDGASKYGPYNWRNYPVKASIYIAAIKRHIDAYEDGEDFAGDSGAHHLGHAIAGCNILLDAIEHGQLVDDRPPSSADVIRRVRNWADGVVKALAGRRLE
jgi:hypothetical protein